MPSDLLSKHEAQEGQKKKEPAKAEGPFLEADELPSTGIIWSAQKTTLIFIAVRVCERLSDRLSVAPTLGRSLCEENHAIIAYCRRNSPRCSLHADAVIDHPARKTHS